MLELELTIATIDEAQEVVNLANDAYRGADGWTSENGLVSGTRLTVDLYSEMVQHDSQKLLLFRKGIELCACIHLERDGDCVHFGCFCVSGKQQRAGIGKYVLKQAEDWAKTNWSTKKVSMDVITIRKELVDYYLRRGYVNTGKQILFPYHDQRFGIPYSENLTFDTLEKEI
ncbi:hypothetical protein HDV01_004686 [Terramyces sp. JEL0728]|nr:hypothetical protein HDV01_004686 [Terramyces sp. JEL0728]